MTVDESLFVLLFTALSILPVGEVGKKERTPHITKGLHTNDNISQKLVLISVPRKKLTLLFFC